MAKNKNKNKDEDQEKSIEDIQTKNAENEEREVNQNAVENREKLQTMMNNMSEDAKNVLIQMLQIETLKELLELMKKLKDVKKETWDEIVKKLKNIKDLKPSKSNGKFDFTLFIEILLPLLGAFIATMLALNEYEEGVAEAQEPEDANTEDDSSIGEQGPVIENKYNSIVLDLCNKNENGFSL